MTWFENVIAAAAHAERELEAAEDTWEEAAAAYRVAYHGASRHVVDDDGFRTGDFEPFTQAETDLLAKLRGAEARAWRRRQAKADALRRAEQALDLRGF